MTSSPLISPQKIEKGMEKNGTFLLKNRKERNGKERGAQPWKDPNERAMQSIYMPISEKYLHSTKNVKKDYYHLK